jgi:RNA polymerase sigma-70 factor (ECF subfamily)
MSEQLADSNRVAGELDMAMVLALGSLSAADQELLLLVAWERLSSEQLAEMLGLSRGTVAVRLHRARRRLRRALAIEEQRTGGPAERAPKMEVFDG